MRIYTTRRECEIILKCLYKEMSTLNIEQMAEFNKLANRIVEINNRQCKSDHSTYENKEEQR